MTSTQSTASVVSAELVGHDGLKPVEKHSFMAALWTLYVLTLRQHRHGRRWLVLAGLFVLPAGLALLIRAIAPAVPPLLLEFLLAFLFIPQGLLPLVALIYASGIIRDEQEEQTITYLLIRPIPKSLIYIVKLAAMVTTTILLTAILTMLTYATIYFSADDDIDEVLLRCLIAGSIHSLAIVAYCSLFGLMSLLTSRSLIVGIIYTVLVEGVLANMPFGIRLFTIIYYTRLIAYRMLSFVVHFPDGDVENLSAEAWQLDVAIDPELAAHPQLSTCLAVLLLGSLVCTFLAAWLCSSREFHVKTPESE
jgi:ABC-2 type transport system permease protein